MKKKLTTVTISVIFMSGKDDKAMYNIETLAKMTGLTRRTIRYYVQRGLIDPPGGGGRGSYYTDDHVKQLEKIKKWSVQGVPLIHMKAMLSGKKPQITVDPPTGIRTILTEQFIISDGIWLTFRPGQLLSRDIVKIRDYINTILKRRKE
ncbi:MAG: MerR family transcriptional regulator [Spirochaetales bacterium]|nr:MerR family transcriptional regulator [Spirochaetales bacterium]